LGEKMVDPNCNTPVWPEPSLTYHAGYATHPLNSVKYIRGLAQICNLDKQKAAFTTPNWSTINQQA